MRLDMRAREGVALLGSGFLKLDGKPRNSSQIGLLLGHCALGCYGTYGGAHCVCLKIKFFF